MDLVIDETLESVSDVLALVRRHLWGQGTFPTSPTDPGVVLVPRSTLERLSLAVC